VEVREGTLAVDASRSGADSPEADEAFDIIAANISALALERLAPALARSLAPDGVLITSGFLADALEDLNRAYGSEGLNIDRVVEDGVWRAIVARAVNR